MASTTAELIGDSVKYETQCGTLLRMCAMWSMAYKQVIRIQMQVYDVCVHMNRFNDTYQDVVG